MSIKNHRKKLKLLIGLMLVFIIFLLIIIIRNIQLYNNSKENEDIQYNQDNTLMFNNNSISETTSDDEVVSENGDFNTEAEYKKYVDSGLIPEFISINFIHISQEKTSVPNYYNKIMNFIKQNDTKALISNLNNNVVNEKKITEENVSEYYNKHGFTRDFEIADIQFWGVSNSVMIITLENTISGAKHYVGINTKFYNNKQIFEVYDEDFFEYFGFKIENQKAVVIDESKLQNAINRIIENNYNSIEV